MYSVIETEEFSEWLDNLKDGATRMERSGALTIMPGGGNKSNQSSDIEQAQQRAKEWK